MAISAISYFRDIPEGALIKVTLKKHLYLVQYDSIGRGNYTLCEKSERGIKDKSPFTAGVIIGQHLGQPTYPYPKSKNPEDRLENVILVSPTMSVELVIRVPIDKIEDYERIGSLKDFETKFKDSYTPHQPRLRGKRWM